MIYYTHNKIGEEGQPVSLEINGNTYYYPNDKLFEKLIPYIGQKITVFYQRDGVLHHKYVYNIVKVFKNAKDIWEVKFDRKDVND